MTSRGRIIPGKANPGKGISGKVIPGILSPCRNIAGIENPGRLFIGLPDIFEVVFICED
jgi:hypothetical protein